MDISMIQFRSRVVSAMREFFLSRDYLELDTPALSPAPLPESCLEVFPSEFRNPYIGTMDLWLLPSPEVYMKQVIADTGRSVYQLCKCYRNSESIGRIHNPEFTMLEYYTVGVDATASIQLTEALFRACAGPHTPQSSLPPFRIMTMHEAFLDLCGLDLLKLDSDEELAAAVRAKGLPVPSGQSWEDSYNQAFVNWVEPALPQDRPLVLRDYPARVECLAADKPGTPWKDRWELYAGGVELANCYTEMASVQAVLSSMKKEAARKQEQQFPHAVDFEYAEQFRDFPLCTGVAMGFERLLLALSGQTDLADVLLFPFGPMFKRWGRPQNG
ncbi:MAG: hypothetical protein KKC64_00870 [Spirochaetes bacterium]|nr:hypothetical protein [Spirochaetota bacterium]